MTTQGIEGALFQMLSHGIVSAALFLVVGVVYDRMHSRDIATYGGLVHRMPLYAFDLHGVHAGVGRAAGHIAASSASSWSWSARSRPTPGSRR